MATPASCRHQPTRQREHTMKGYCSARRSPAVPVRVQRHLTPLPTPPPPDDRIPTPSRNVHPLRHPGPDHQLCQPAHHTPTHHQAPTRPTTFQRLLHASGANEPEQNKTLVRSTPTVFQPSAPNLHGGCHKTGSYVVNEADAMGDTVVIRGPARTSVAGPAVRRVAA
jgi:hypothetical protein